MEISEFERMGSRVEIGKQGIELWIEFCFEESYGSDFWG
jgi:hypothetical protein